MPIEIIGGAGDGFAQPLRQHFGVLWILELGLNDCKFVAAQARDQIGLAKAAAETLRDHLQQLVAGRMAQVYR